MPIDERDQALLYDMLSAARHHRMILAGRPMGDLFGDRTPQWATDSGFNILGSDATKALHPAIEWRRTIGLRSLVVHEYDAVDYSRHWTVIKDDRPQLIAGLEKASS